MPHSQDETEIRALVENWAAAARAKDMPGALAHHSADIVMFDVPMPVQSRGIAEYQKTWELFFAHVPGGPGSFDLTELQITAGDTVAYAHALIHVGGSVGRLTMGLRKQDGRWIIAHEHHSYPIELGAASTDTP